MGRMELVFKMQVLRNGEARRSNATRGEERP
jgi:hypothetical protein